METSELNPSNEKQSGEKLRPLKKPKNVTQSLHDLLGGDYLSKDRVIKNMPFFFYLAFLALIFIGNTYYAEKTFKQIEQIKSELRELRYQYLTSKSALMFYSKQTEIAKKVIRSGIKETDVPPYKIFYSPEPAEKDE